LAHNKMGDALKPGEESDEARKKADGGGTQGPVDSRLRRPKKPGLLRKKKKGKRSKPNLERTKKKSKTNARKKKRASVWYV